MSSNTKAMFDLIRSASIAFIEIDIRHCLTEYQEVEKRSMMKFEKLTVECTYIKIEADALLIVSSIIATYHRLLNI